MSDYFFDKIRNRFSGTGVGTNAGVSVTQAAVANRKHVCAGIQGSSDAACLITVESPAGTILWKKRKAAAGDFSESFAPGCVVGVVGAALLVKVSASTSNSEANIQGFTLNG